MSGERLVRRPFALALVGFASLAFIAAFAPGRAAAATCPDQYGCLWGQPDYAGAELDLDGSTYGGVGWLVLSFNYNSAKNRYVARKLKLGRHTDTGVDQIACLDPGENRPDPGWFDRVWVSDITSDQCG
jgi:hypothetical protein